MVDFAKLRANKGSSLAKLTEKLESMNTNSGGQKDERIFRPGFDKKESKGYAVIRFLPAQEGEPFVKRISHGFQGQGGWYIETSRITAGLEDDPVAVSNRLYWAKGEAEGNDALKNVSRKRKRVTKYFANVYVVKDTVNPANDGKVMLYEFGPQIFSMIEKAIKPEFEDDEPLDPFDMWTGADFRIKIIGKEIPDNKDPSKKVIVPNYEDSEFTKSTEFFKGDDEKKEEIFLKTFDLSEFTKVKTFEELAARFEKVTGERHDALEAGDPADKVVASLEKAATLEQEQEAPKQDKVSEPRQEKVADAEPEAEEDDVLAMFRNLAAAE
jgi:hypothetical protein